MFVEKGYFFFLTVAEDLRDEFLLIAHGSARSGKCLD